MKKYKIQENDFGQRLDKFLFKLAPKLTKSMLFKSIRKKDIKLNGEKAEASTILQKNDIVEIYLHSKFFSKSNLDFLLSPANVEVIYEDANILIINKPVGLLMHQGIDESKDNLTNRMIHYLYDNNVYDPETEFSFVPAFCNRLDRNTRGLVIAAKNFQTLQLLNEKMKNREIVRKYLTIVKGVPEKKFAKLSDYHKKTENNMAIISREPKEDYSLIETNYKIMETYESSSLLEVELITGKFHQIRAHLASIGHPIIGDKKYGYKSRAKVQKLVAYYIGFRLKDDSGPLAYLSGKHFSLDTETLF